MQRIKHLQPRRRHAVVAAMLAGGLFFATGGAAMAMYVLGGSGQYYVNNAGAATFTITNLATTGTVSPGTDGNGDNNSVAQLTGSVTNNTASSEHLTSFWVTLKNDGSGNVETYSGGTPVAVPGCLMSWYMLGDAGSSILDGDSSAFTSGAGGTLVMKVGGSPGTPIAIAGGASVTFDIQVSMGPTTTNQDVCAAVQPAFSIVASGTQP